jgi:DNA helicase-2/ATP-dependent DNA helicase PcrA
LSFSEPSRFIGEIDQQYIELPTGIDLPSFLGGQNENPFFQKPKTFGAPMEPPRRTTPSAPPVLSKRLTNLQKAQARPSFESDDPNLITLGCEVEHQRFGRGKVLELEGDENSRKATVLFQNAGRKQLLIKFARLKVVG